MKSLHNFYKTLSDDAKQLYQAMNSVHHLYNGITEYGCELCLKMENKTYSVETRDVDGFSYGFNDVTVNVPNIESAKEEIRKMLADYTDYYTSMKERAEARKEQRAMSKAIELLDVTMISVKEAKEMLKEIGCAQIQKTGIKVQEWYNEEKTRFWTKASHTKMKIKCRFNEDFTKVCKEDIESALKAVA